MGINIAIFSYFDTKFPGTVEFGEYPLFFKWPYYYIAMVGQRFLYYVVWCWTDATCIAAGLGYNGKEPDGRNRWDKIVGIYIIDVECGISPVIMFKVTSSS